MATKTIATGHQKVKLAYRQLVQDVAHEREVDPESVEPTLMLSGHSYDDLESHAQALEACLAEQVALAAKGYQAKITELHALRDEAREIRKQLEADQILINDRWARLRAMEERANHAHALQSAQNSAEREMMNSRRKRLGTTDLESFPSLA